MNTMTDVNENVNRWKISFEDVWREPVGNKMEDRVFTPTGNALLDTLTERVLKEKRRSAVKWAKELGITPDRLYETVRTLADMTAAEWIATLTIRLIIYYLLHTTWSYKEISRCVGFTSSNTMEKFFYRHVGCRIREYREAHQRVTVTVTKTIKIEQI
jgi:AraC-like DNA-binding protein